MYARTSPKRTRMRCVRWCDFVLSLACLAALVHVAKGQDIVSLDEGAVAFDLALRELRTTASLLHVVAHPDDEDGPLLAYVARGLGADTMLFSLTRGEGGANLISADFFDELGGLRTLEHRKAADYYGNRLFYSRAADYGYSKTLEEAMRNWQNGIPLLADLVEVIRREQPMVIVSRFRGDARDGHGHHQMAGVLSRLAFDAAGDPQQFPDQIHGGLRPWQPRKLYVGAGRQGGDHDTAIPTGTYDRLLGKSYAQVARFGLGFQRSQGISGHDGEPGPRTSYYRLEKSVAPSNQSSGNSIDPSDSADSTLFQGVPQQLADWIAHESVRNRSTQHESETNQAIGQYARMLRDWDRTMELIWQTSSARHPDASVPLLGRQLDQIRALLDDPEFVRLTTESQDPSGSATSPFHPGLIQVLKRREQQLQRVIALAVGVRLDGEAHNQDGGEIHHGVAGESISVRAQISHQGLFPEVEIVQLTCRTPDQEFVAIDTPTRLQPEESVQRELTVQLPDSPTRQYWSRAELSETIYDVRAESMQNSLPIPPLQLKGRLLVLGRPIDIYTNVQNRYRHAELGDVRYPLAVVPPVSVRFPLGSGIFPLGQSRTSSYEVSVMIRGTKSSGISANVRLELPEGWTSDPEQHRITLSREDEEAHVGFQIRPTPDVGPGDYPISAVVEAEGERYREGFQTITARDLDRLNLYHPARHRIRVADIQLTGSPQVAYIAGSGDQVAESLAPLGIKPTFLSASDLAQGNLSTWDVILVGVRAYAVREDLRKYNSRLLDYVHRGGVLIVQYQTPEFDHNFGPFPYQMGPNPEEVSEETAHVSLLQPTHPLLQTPNRITHQDFEGWFEQRGSKFWKTWDERYVSLLECHDQGQPPQTGSLLVARHGQGTYVYAALAWYRQLPQGVSGAYRLFANLLSLPATQSSIR